MKQQRSRFAQLLTNLREQAGLTLYALEQRSGVVRSTLWRIERDELTPDPPTLNAIARGLDMEPEELYDAAWSYLEPEQLPALPGYFRQKYRLSVNDIAYLQETVDMLGRAAAHRRATTRKKGRHEDDATEA